MIQLFYLLAALQVLFGLYLIYEGIRWIGYARRRLLRHSGFYAPRVAVLCPCKGTEPGLEANLTALCEFDYSNFNYEIFFILASQDDPAYSVLRRLAERSRAKAHIVIAGPPEGCGEKVHNLRSAVRQLPEEFEALVFTDSDGRPGRHWLQKLVAPLGDGRVGAATTMRWFLPNRENLATALLAAWNAPIVTLLGENRRNFCWGGGTAIRRSVFEQANVLEEWQNSVSDDYSLTRALEHIGRPIVFVPECLTVSLATANFAGLMEFTNRQIVITRVYAPWLWYRAAATHGLYCLTLALGVYATLETVLASRPAFQLLALTFLPVLLSVIRGALRLSALTEVLPVWKSKLVQTAWIWTVLNVFVPFLYVLNFVNSLFTRKIRWRGIQYELISPNQTRILSPQRIRRQPAAD